MDLLRKTLISKISEFSIVYRFFTHIITRVENPFLSRGSPLSSTSTSIVADSRATRQLPDGIDIAGKAYHAIEMFAIYIYTSYVVDKFPFFYSFSYFLWLFR